MTAAVIDVLVVEHQALFRAGLIALIRGAPDLRVVAEAATGGEDLERALAARPDVVVLDVAVSAFDWVAVVERIASTRPSPPRVLVLTSLDVDDHVRVAVQAGASGFVLKDSPPHRLLAAIRAVAAGDTLLGPCCAVASSRSRLRELTRREMQVLELVATGMSNPQIARRLMVSEATVKTHLNRTMSKLDLESRAQVVVVAYESGLILPAYRRAAS